MAPSARDRWDERFLLMSNSLLHRLYLLQTEFHSLASSFGELMIIFIKKMSNF